MGEPLELLRSMMLIRRFEAALMQRPDHGFQLLSSGQEAVAVGVCAVLLPQDRLLSSGRSIGPALARGLDPGRVMAELLGKSAGPCRGKGGRGHLADPTAGFLGAHAVVGGNLSIAAGAALATQLARESSAVVCVFGDGACGSGALHETLNLAALWRLPLVLVCDNNQLSVSTPRREALAPRYLSDLAAPFGIPGETVDGMDALAVRAAMYGHVQRARNGGGPGFVECTSERFMSHSSAVRDTRTPEELVAIRARCPILRLTAHLLAAGADASALDALGREVDGAISDALRFADASPPADPAEVLNDVV